MDNPLLAMLKSVGLPPPVPEPQQPAQSPAHPSAPVNGPDANNTNSSGDGNGQAAASPSCNSIGDVSGPGAIEGADTSTGAPNNGDSINRPSSGSTPVTTASPPAQLHTVSIDDLFRAISSPAASTVTTGPAATATGAGLMAIPGAPTGVQASAPTEVSPAVSPPGAGLSPSSVNVTGTAPTAPVSSPLQAPAPDPQATKLLGMLNLGVIGTPAATSSLAASTTATPTHARTVAPVPSNGLSGAPTAISPNQDQQRKNSLLNVLRSPPVGNPHQADAAAQPVSMFSLSLPSGPALPTAPGVIHRRPSVAGPGPQPRDPSPASVGSGPAQSTGPTGPQSREPTTSDLASQTTRLDVPSEQPSQAVATPTKSMFDFVSPFDAFVSPKPKSTVASQTASQNASHVASPASQDNAQSQQQQQQQQLLAALTSPHMTASNDDAPTSTIPVANLPPKVHSLAAPPANRKAQTPALAVHARKTSSPSLAHNLKSKTDPSVWPWLVSKLVKPLEGNGPKTMTSPTTVIDLSQPGTDAVVSPIGAIQVIPTTLMKAEHVSFHRGRAVATTKTWLAYTLSRGRVRLIDRMTGARAMLQLSATGPVQDLAVTTNGLAAVGSDGAVSVYQVPTTWDRDDPSCPLIFRLGPIDPESLPSEQSLGDLNHVEWVHRNGLGAPAEWLAIGGTEGVVLVKPSDYAEAPDADAREIVSGTKVLKTSGTLSAFCLNVSNQAIGLLSTSSYFCLYGVANLNRVWHRQLPSSSPMLTPSSVQFCEANIIVGRANNTVFDLVQITVELTVLSTLKFIAPAPAPPHLHFTHAAYDTASSMFFVSPFARGSMYAFRYALKGQSPQRTTSPDGFQAFDSYAEIPLSPVLSFVLGSSADGDVEIFYSTASGINQGHIDLKNMGNKSAPGTGTTSSPAPTSVSAPSIPTVLTAAAPMAEQRQVSAKAEKKATKLAKQGSPTRETGEDADKMASTPEPLAGYSTGLTTDDLTKALRRNEERISSTVRQSVQKEVAQLSTGLSTTISSAVNNHLRSQLPSVVQQEIKRALPQALTSVQGEVRQTIAEQAPAAIQHSVQGLSRDLERSILPVVQRTLAQIVQPAVDRAMHESMRQVLVPALDSATNRVYDQLASNLKSEMVQIRKDVAGELGESLGATNAMLQNMASTIGDLQKQIATLSSQLNKQQTSAATHGPPPPPPPGLGGVPPQPAVNSSRYGAPMGPVPIHIPSPSAYRSGPFGPGQAAMAQDSAAAPVPPAPAAPAPLAPAPAPAPPAPTSKQYEDAFLAALQQQTTDATLRLVADYGSRTATVLPNPPAHSPLSQAVLLTLFHRLSIALNDPALSPHSALFGTAAKWISQSALLLDPRNPEIGSYYPRVASLVVDALKSTLAELSKNGEQRAAAQVSAALEAVTSKRV